MPDFVEDTREILKRLEALQASGVLTQAETASCSGLAEALRRPARVAVLGQSAADLTGILHSLVGETVVTMRRGGPVVELRHGTSAGHEATFGDGSSLGQAGYPTDDLMRYGPVFLRIEAPLPALSAMSFLGVGLGEEPEDYVPALSWAAKRSEIAIFCAPGFGDGEAEIWSQAPDRLKNHCYLVVTGEGNTDSARARGCFDAVIHAPVVSQASAPLGALRHRLAADIAAARQEDIDAAELFLHRFRSAGPEWMGATDETPGTQQPPETEDPSPGRPPSQEINPAAADSEGSAPSRTPDAPSRKDRAAARTLVSAPILHLKRRSRALAELLEWREEDEDWSTEVLDHCIETAEALRDLVSAWPDDDPVACRLRDAIDEACDTVVLLQVESGPDQAEDAARVLYQLRTDFEQEMAA